MINLFLKSQSSSPTPETSNTGSGSFLIYSLLLTLLAIINIYLIIKFFVNYKRSISKTKEVLDKYLVKKYVQGFNFKSNAFYNTILISILLSVQIIFSSVALSKVYANLNETSKTYISFFIAGIAFATLLGLSFAIALGVIYHIKFNYPQYKSKDSDVYSEIISLKEIEKPTLNNKYPKKIDLDVEKLKSSNVLLSNVLKKWITFYNTMEEVKFKKQYNLFLDQLFKINYFNEVQLKIKNYNEKHSEIENELLPEIEKSNLDKIEKEIIWMDKMDKKAKILNETKELAKMSKEEFNKKYEEYVYSARANDPLYQSATKNSWLFYRDSEVEDLFFNPNTTVNYSLGEDKEVYEKELGEFFKEYKDYLVSKFLLTKE